MLVRNIAGLGATAPVTTPPSPVQPPGSTLTPATFAQEAKWFATLDLNSIFKEAQKALISIISITSEYVSGWAYSDADKQLGERMVFQIPYMMQGLAKAGVLDATLANTGQTPDQVAQTSTRNYGHYEKVVPLARQVLCIFFGVRLWNDHYLDALEQGADAYYAIGQGSSWPTTTDVPRAAVDRAVMLKQTYFSRAMTYNKKAWDMNKFSQFPLVAPIPDPFTPGKLYNGTLPFGGTVTNGIMSVPDNPLSSVATGPAGATNDNTMWLLLAALGLGAWWWYENDKKKKHATRRKL